MYSVYKLAEDDGVCPVDEWLDTIRDKTTRARILRRIDKLERGSFGDHKFFDGIGELRIDLGPGYRVYFATYGTVLALILLTGGDKKSQQNDISKAKDLLAKWKKQNPVIELLPSWSEIAEQHEHESAFGSD